MVGANKTEAEQIDALFASIVMSHVVVETSGGRTATLDDLRRVLLATYENDFQKNRVSPNAAQRTKLLDLIDSYIANAADTLVAAGVQDTRRTGLYI